MKSQELLIALLINLLSASVAKAVTLPTPPIAIPRPIQFHVAINEEPDEEGNFSLSCFILATVSKTRVKAYLDPADDVTILSAPKKLKGWARPGHPVIFTVKGRVSQKETRPTALAIHLRYLIPFAGMRQKVTETEDEIANDSTLENNSLEFLSELEANDNNIETLHRCVILD